MPILVARDEVEAAASLAKVGDADALRIGRSLDRVVRNQVAEQSRKLSTDVIEQIRELYGSAAAGFLPPSEKRLDTDGIAARTNLSAKTIRRLCSEGQIDADKTNGGQWRTTEDRLWKSRYFKGRRGGRGAELE
jgi:hypothetical protein